MAAEIKEEGKKSGKVELFFSLVDKSFKIILLMIGVVFIIMYYTNSNGRYQYVTLEEGQSAILDTREGIIHSFSQKFDFTSSMNLADGKITFRKVKFDGEPPAQAPAPGAPVPLVPAPAPGAPAAPPPHK